MLDRNLTDFVKLSMHLSYDTTVHFLVYSPEKSVQKSKRDRYRADYGNVVS